MSRKKPPKKLEAVPPQTTIARRSKPWIDPPPATELATDPLGDILRQQLQQGEEYQRQTPQTPTP